jgi:hypothetical protein
VRAEGFEPSRSLEHRHLKPACLPFHHARGLPIVPLEPSMNLSVVPSYLKRLPTCGLDSPTPSKR